MEEGSIVYIHSFTRTPAWGARKFSVLNVRRTKQPCTLMSKLGSLFLEQEGKRFCRPRFFAHCSGPESGLRARTHSVCIPPVNRIARNAADPGESAKVKLSVDRSPRVDGGFGSLRIVSQDKRQTDPRGVHCVV